MTAYYNEYDAKAAAWLRELIKSGLIAPGEVDERSIIDVKADELRGFTQCHFFAGIGGWSYALRLAGWPDDQSVWTGSPPCQPFSNAGKQKAQADARHLWPVFFNLIRECQPTNIFGEQVEAAIRTGWLDDLQDDLEAENYATGKVILPACSVGGFHIRQRIWFVAERLADTASDRCQRQGQRWPAEERREPQPGTDRQLSAGLERSGDNGGLAESESSECQFTGRTRPRRKGLANDYCDSRTDTPETFWANPDWLFCRDGKWRPVESGTFPLAHGLSERVGLLRGYGNAIVPQVAAEVIRAYMEAGYEL